jgi:hypothetical protein
LGIWIPHNDLDIDNQEWVNFKQLINSMGLSWEFSERTNTVTFMDLTITLLNGTFNTSLYTKPMALHLYIPPHSCHAPGIITGLIFGHFLRVHQLCTHQHDIDKEIHLFYQRLTQRGHPPSTILPLFKKAELAVLQRLYNNHETDQPTSSTQDKSRLHSQLFLHLPFHPMNPPSTRLQSLWQTIVASPSDDEPLTNLKNNSGYTVPIKKLTIAYSRAPSLGNLLSCRKLKLRS